MWIRASPLFTPLNPPSERVVLKVTGIGDMDGETSTLGLFRREREECLSCRHQSMNCLHRSFFKAALFIRVVGSCVHAPPMLRFAALIIEVTQDEVAMGNSFSSSASCLTHN